MVFMLYKGRDTLKIIASQPNALWNVLVLANGYPIIAIDGVKDSQIVAVTQWLQREAMGANWQKEVVTAKRNGIRRI